MEKSKRTLCCSVRVKELKSISEKAVKITTHDGSSDIFPKSAIFSQDYEVEKSDAYWIALWILEKKTLTFSRKKQAWCGTDGSISQITFTIHTPIILTPKESNEIPSLLAD